MTNVTVKDAKETYIATGRLNRNIISKEISISWYKCKLQNLNPKDSIKYTGEKSTINFDSKFLTFIDSIVPQYFDYIMVNMSLQKCSSRMLISNFTEMDTIDDLAIGTNGGYLTYKTQSNQLVSQDEHYLDCLSDHFTYGILVSQDEKILGVLMLISKEKPNEYDIAKIREKMVQYNAKAEVSVSKSTSNIASVHSLAHLFAYPEQYMQEFHQLIDKIGSNTLPLLIRGNEGSGKSTLARYLAETQHKIPFIISLNDTPQIMHRVYIENGLSQFDTVIIEGIERADSESLSLLTVYMEENILSKTRDKQSNYKCSKLIMTTVNNDQFSVENNLSKQQYKQLTKFLDKMKLNTVNLLNTNDFSSQLETLVDAILIKNGVNATDAYKIKLLEYSKRHSFKSIQQIIEISMEDVISEGQKLLTDFPVSITNTILDLESYEKAYILKIYDLLDNNMTATASILNIGRSTLYRKLEKYQNDTLDLKK